jgi:putative transposase
MKRCRYVPRVIITDNLASYGAAKKSILPGVEHRQHKGLNNRAENSHQPPRQQERQRRRFKSPGQAQRFLSAFEPITGHFRLRRHRMPAADYRAERTRRFASWNAVTGAQMAV